MKFFPVKKGNAVILIVLLLLIAIRIPLPPILLTFINKGLEERSPIYAGHIDDLDLSILRMAYSFDGVQLTQKSNQQIFLRAETVDVSLAWRDLLRGRVTTDIDVKFADFDVDKGIAVFAADNHAQAKVDAKMVKDNLFPVDIERVKIRQSRMSFFPIAASSHEVWRVSDIDATMTNITSSDTNPVSPFLGTGTLLGSAKVKFAGQAHLMEKPVDWKTDVELRGFDLTAANPILAKLVPVTFKSGSLELYSEVKSEKGKILGYVQPFAEKLEVVGDAGDFKGVGHFFIEILAEFVNFVAKNPKQESLATQIDFGTIDGKMKVNTIKAIKLALRHGFIQELKPKKEDVLELSPQEKK